MTPVGLGADCGAGPTDVLVALSALARSTTGMALVTKPSASLPSGAAGSLHYAITPSDMAQFARDAIARGASIVGGCCGTTPDHIAAMRQAMPAVPD